MLASGRAIIVTLFPSGSYARLTLHYIVHDLHQPLFVCPPAARIHYRPACCSSIVPFGPNSDAALMHEMPDEPKSDPSDQGLNSRNSKKILFSPRGSEAR